MTIHPETSSVSDRLSGENGSLRAFSRAEFGRVLESERRREVLRYLLDTDEPITVQRLVGWLADTENDAAVLTTILEVRQRIHVALCRTHLPLLDRHGIVQYDRERGLVSPAANLTAFEAALEDNRLERSW